MALEGGKKDLPSRRSDMKNNLKRWMLHRGKIDPKEIDLGDVEPEHPDEYPARHLKERLDGRRDSIEEIEGGPKGMPEGPGGF
jgi:hypothetical protein